MVLSGKYVEMLRLGHDEGLRYFMSKFGASLRFFAFKIIKDKEVSEEIVSESFYKLWKRKEKIDSLAYVESFLFCVTRNACLDYVESSYYRHSVFVEEDVLENIAIPDIFSQIIYVELIEQITSELKNLPRQQAEVFRMSYLEGIDTDEICKKLGTTTSNVYFARSKAIATLRLIFKEKDISLYGNLLMLSFWHRFL